MVGWLWVIKPVPWFVHIIFFYGFANCQNLQDLRDSYYNIQVFFLFGTTFNYFQTYFRFFAFLPCYLILVIRTQFQFYFRRSFSEKMKKKRNNYREIKINWLRQQQHNNKEEPKIICILILGKDWKTIKAIFTRQS